MADLCSGDQGQHAVHHAQTGAQDGNQGQLAASQHMGASQSNRGFHFNFLGGQVAGGLIAQQGGNFADQITELFGAGVAVTHQADFVLDQGMVYNFNNAHGRFSLQDKNSSDTMQSLVPGGVQQWGSLKGFPAPSSCQCASGGGRPQIRGPKRRQRSGRQGRGPQRGRPGTGYWRCCGGGCTRR